MSRRDSLKRRPASREPRRRFTLFCEGSKTEPGYFEAIKARHRDALIEVRIVATGAVPMTLAKEAVKARKAQLKRGDSHEKDDEIWVVVDRDTHPHFDTAMELCRTEGVKVARSNPCFELWLILHYEHYDRPGTNTQVQRHFQTLCKEYKRSRGKQVNCTPLLGKVEEAERRAAKQLQAREEDSKPFHQPSTTVGHLTAAMRIAAAKFQRRR